ncbi:MAG TPA: hypothetical protein VLG44_02410, partial [Chlamydiales bacterium]|nr:hypothetical protein [Chlamydiales bacterium]
TGIVRNEIDTSHERARADNQDGGEFFKKIIERQPQSFKEKVETGDAEIFVELPKLALEEALTSSLPHFMEKYRNDIELLRHLNGQERKNKFDAISTELMKDVDCISAMQNAIRPNETETDLGLSSQDGSEPGILEEQTLAPPNKLVKAEGKGKKVPIWGYNLSYILITQAYIPKDAMIHDKAMGYIDKGKEHFRQLDVVVALTKKVKTMTKDKPQKIDFSTDEKAKELLQKAWELGFADKDKLVYTDKEAEILLSDLDTNSKILPQRAQISFNMVPTLTEKQTQLAKIVQSAHKEEKDLVQRAQSRSIKGG